MMMPGRKYQSVILSGAEGYWYGFNGKEKDKEMNSLTAYDYGFRIYNPGIGKFLSVDPLTSSYPSWSPYPFAMNRVIDGIDIDGLEYINGTESKISIYINLFTSNNTSVIYGKVSLNYDKISIATQNFILSWKQKAGEIGTDAATVATFKHTDYESLVAQHTASLSIWIKQPSAEDIPAPTITKQPENVVTLRNSTKLPNIAKDPAYRYNRNPNRNPQVNNTPPNASDNTVSRNFTGQIATGTIKGDGIIAMISLTGEYLKDRGLTRINNDYNTAESQLSAVPNVLNKVQYAIDNKLISTDLTAFANYLLDGRSPTYVGTYTNKSGQVEVREYTDTVSTP